MLIFKTYLGLITLVSIAIILIMAKKILSYNKRYKMPESKYTKLFGIITKEIMLFLYLICASLFAIFAFTIIINI